MTHYDQTLKTYADNGFRSADEWLTLGREVTPGAEPRAEAMHHRQAVALYTRAQTRPRASRSRGAGVGVH